MKETLASELLREQNDKIFSIVWKLNYMSDDFEKVLFMCEQVLDKVYIAEPKETKDAFILHENMQDIDSMMGIILDYVRKLQSEVVSIVGEERDSINQIINDRRGENGRKETAERYSEEWK